MVVVLEVLVDTETGDWTLDRALEKINDGHYRVLNLDDVVDEQAYYLAARLFDRSFTSEQLDEKVIRP